MEKKKQISMKQKAEENWLYKKPIRKKDLNWSVNENKVVLEIENKGFYNRLAQKLFKKPPITYVDLDEMGSFIWPLLNGEANIEKIGEMVEANFGERAHPLYERLTKYFQILNSYGFVEWLNED